MGYKKYESYFFEKRVMQAFGNDIIVYDKQRSEKLLYIKHRSKNFKEEIIASTDKESKEIVFTIKARGAIDFSTTYDIFDPVDKIILASVKRRGYISIFRDYWYILNYYEEVIGMIVEDNLFLSLIRRFTKSLIPMLAQKYRIFLNESFCGSIRQTYHPLKAEYYADFSEDTEKKLDRRIAIASVALLQVIEGKQR